MKWQAKFKGGWGDIESARVEFYKDNDMEVRQVPDDTPSAG